MGLAQIVFERGLVAGAGFGAVPFEGLGTSVAQKCANPSAARWEVRPILGIESVDDWRNGMPPPERSPIVYLHQWQMRPTIRPINSLAESHQTLWPSPWMLRYIIGSILYHVGELSMRYTGDVSTCPLRFQRECSGPILP